MSSDLTQTLESLAEEAAEPFDVIIFKTQITTAAFRPDDATDDGSVSMSAMLEAAAQSLARSAELLTKTADERSAVAAELLARGCRIDRTQKETRTMLDALVAGHD